VRRAFELSYVAARRVAVALVGVSVALLGAAMIVLPGPGLLVLPLGLGILAAEFAWARRWLDQLRRRGRRLVDQLSA